MEVPSAALEFRTIQLKDRRLEDRARLILGRLEAAPDVGFPQAMKEAAEVEAFYRFTNNPRVWWEELLAAHARESWLRADSIGPCLVLHDTTEMAFPGEAERVGLEKRASKSVFHAHVALAVSEGEAAVVHGVVGMRNYIIEDHAWVEVDGRGEGKELLSGANRWGDLVADVHAEAGLTRPLIHVMDREADDYTLMSKILDHQGNFVIRSLHDRTVDPLGGSAVGGDPGGSGKLTAALAGVSYSVSRPVQLSRRGSRRLPADRKTHPDRESRVARLQFRWTAVDLRRPGGVGKSGPSTLKVWVVEVVEPEPPPGEAPVYWRLLTSLPIENAEDALRVVDIYRKRWLIEEYFRTLKTGCSAEKRQAESLSALLNVTCLLVPVAWRLMVLREVARNEPEGPASLILDDIEIQALRHISPRAKFSAQPKAREAIAAIARLGGHLRSNGEPGILVLFRGLQQLLAFAAGWRAAVLTLHAAPAVN